jgi:hypothetical protein
MSLLSVKILGVDQGLELLFVQLDLLIKFFMGEHPIPKDFVEHF